MEKELKSKSVLIVDDVPENRYYVAEILSTKTKYRVMTASDGDFVFQLDESNYPDLILLDIMMPGINGYEAANIMKDNPDTKDIPIIFLTANEDRESIVQAFKHGGVDYITKPFHSEELLARVNAQMRLKVMQDELKQKNKMLANSEIHLKHLVDEKTDRIEKVTMALVTVLEDANLANDDDTGNHIKRVSEYSALIADEYGMDNEMVKKIKLYASLHDVGKVGIPDSILKKPGKYTEDEFAIMKQHVIIGGKMLDNPDIDIMARNIALYHHEKWNGTGYGHGLKGSSIPIEARIVALADVFDALVTKRVYKEPFSLEKTDSIIKSESKKHFDPDIVEIYFKNKSRIVEIKNFLRDK
ncbi:MAG: response regulator [Thermodesulfobacteriota bacterium]|nr:response regulator [Thermodesulfobacteriota bacterium]